MDAKRINYANGRLVARQKGVFFLPVNLHEEKCCGEKAGVCLVYATILDWGNRGSLNRVNRGSEGGRRQASFRAPSIGVLSRCRDETHCYTGDYKLP